MAADDVQRSTAASRAANDQGDGNRSQANIKPRRRTKTGCLTCRKRRIKCDEGRPTCNNCFKSKRQCEGYQPSPMQFQATGNEYSQHLMTMPYQPHVGDAKQPGNHSHILPRPPPPGQYQSDPDPASESQWADPSAYMRETDLDQPDMVSVMMAANQVSPSAMAYIHQFPNIVQNVRAAQPALMTGTNPAFDTSSGSFAPAQPLFKGAQEHYNLQNLNGPMNAADMAQFAVPNPVSPEGFVWNPNIHAYDQRLYTSIPPGQFDYTESFAEEEMYDVGSDDEGFNGMPERTEPMGLPLIMAAHSNFDVRALRTHDTFLNTPNILVHYEPQWLASPLSDPTTARIFTHFIAVTACHLSLGQRRASNPSLLFQPSVPKSQQGLWTYILPQKALTNQGLMHAMLALASLQIAMLQGTDRHTARKHYHFAIRRNSNAVGSPKKRTSIATIATTLLLGCFEVWAADHSNWNSHLIGARQLLLEAEFVRQSRQIKEHRYQAAPLVSPDDPYALYLQQKAGPVLQADLPDEDFLERITGFALPYSDHGVKAQEEEASPPLSQYQVDHYDTYADLFWFYLKQDIYYSTISSNPLLLPYSRWADCPPRAPMGKLDAIYGTSDHLILIYGRIAKFISEDLVRKKKAVEANGGHWRPPPGMFPGAAAGRVPGMPAKGKPPGGAPSPQGPGFMGMIPTPPTPRMPSAFKENNNRGTPYMPAPKEEQDVGDLGVAFERALVEWGEIRAVLKEFKAALQAVEWQALPIHAARPIATHFGSALQYGDYRIADIWGMFYTAKIILARVHPAMPPAAMMAAAVCAPQTAKWANTIGKIVFGMQTPASDEPLNPTFASVLTQNMYCLFFAGVQYSEPEQRLICVDRLRYIAEKVGHESSALIAAALETCWINAFKMGRGPEWQRTLGLAVDTGDENRKTEFRTMERKKDGATVYIRNDELRTQFGMGIMGLESDFTRLRIIDNYGFNIASSARL